LSLAQLPSCKHSGIRCLQACVQGDYWPDLSICVQGKVDKFRYQASKIQKVIKP
jgi:hypothetical protein